MTLRFSPNRDVGNISVAALAHVSTVTTRTQRAATSTPIAVQSTDMVINVDISSGSPTCTLPVASTRSGVPVTFKDVGGNFASHNLTIFGDGSETIDGNASITLNANYQAVTLYPFNDGVNTGWFIT